MNGITNEKNRMELNPEELEQACGGSLLDWMKERFIEPVIKVYDEYRKRTGR